LLLELDTDTGAIRTALTWETPPEHRPAEDPSILFKMASWDGDHLLCCTQTEVVVVDPRQGRVVRVVSHPWFNDVHHAARIDGRLHVVSTGLDALLVLDDDDRVVEVRSATGSDPWERFDRATDYRRVATTKPHRAHPNFVSCAAGTRWLTRFEQGDALPLDADRPPLAVSTDRIHDGVVHGDALWFTAVSGHVIRADPASGAVTGRWDLNPLGDGTPLGWCRGVLVEEGRTLVGFSRLRPTTFKQNLAWLRAPLNRAPEPLPCRVAAYDLRQPRLLGSWNLEDAGMSAVFGICAWEPGQAAATSQAATRA
jgi:hypothetical protein